uniref:Cytochrome P450 n=1 Tax=Aplanochytrium stocchinoi TaxID=215587 RepID=A0A6S8BK88_9STRA
MFGRGWEESDDGDRIYALHKHLIANVNKYMFLPWLQPFGYAEFVRKNQEWRGLCNKMLDIRAAEIKENPEKFKNDETALTMLLTSKDKEGNPFFTRSRMVSTVCGFLNGAYDTTHATTFWLIYHLAKYPEIQEKLRLEIFKVLGSRKTCSVEEARQIEYLEAYIKESMRYVATVPINQRINYEEDITVGGWKIPKGTCVNIPNTLAFMNPDYFGPDADSFRPERFMTGDPWAEKAKRTWSAFGAYKRMCIGFTFALVELKAILISILQRYKVELVDPNIKPEIMVEAGVNQPKNHVLLRFIKHDAQAIAVENNLVWWGLQTSAQGA